MRHKHNDGTPRDFNLSKEFYRYILDLCDHLWMKLKKNIFLVTFLITESTYINSLNCITFLDSHRVIVMEQLIPFKEWRGFALEFGFLISFCYRSVFHWTRILLWLWCLNEQRRRHLQRKKKQTSHLLRLKIFGQYCYVNRLWVTFVVCFKHPSQLGGEIPGENSCLRAFCY